jgi:hypothetical protein
MRKLTLFLIISILPIYSFADHFWVSTPGNVNDDMFTIEKNGYIIKDLKMVDSYDYGAKYIIKYGK